MKNLLNLNDRELLIARLQALKPDSGRRWGIMNAGQVVSHMTDPLRVAIGDRTAEPMRGIFSKPVFNVMVVWWLPWPKGAPTADAFIQGKGGTPPVAFERDKQALLLAIHRFAHHPENAAFLPNPVFGRLSRRSWGRLMWRHIDHHLRQFGL